MSSIRDRFKKKHEACTIWYWEVHGHERFKPMEVVDANNTSTLYGCGSIGVPKTCVGGT